MFESFLNTLEEDEKLIIKMIFMKESMKTGGLIIF